MNFKLETEFSKAEVLQEVDALKKQIDAMRPLPADVEGKVMQKLRLDWNYNSNAIEGNRLDYGETTALLMHGITAQGKPLKDHLDIQGHNDAINFLLSIIKEDRLFSESDIRALHQMILVEPYVVPAETESGNSTTKQIQLGVYKTSPNHVKTITGEIHYYALPEEIPAKMRELMQWFYSASENKDIHPIVIAALFHHKFVEIHPFDDGNGRLSRILMNLILMRNSYPPTIIKKEDKENYYALLSKADVGDSWPFVEYIIDRLKSSLELYLKAANGGDIDEEEDIDKEIALFKMQIREDVKTKEKKSKRTINKILQDVIGPLSYEIFEMANKFSDLFFVHDQYVNIKYKRSGIDNDEFFDAINAILINRINVVIDSFGGLYLINDFKEFRNPDNDFDITLIVKIIFDEYHYKIVDNREVTFISKLYHENISKEEKKIIIKSVAESLKNIIQIKLKSPKS